MSSDGPDDSSADIADLHRGALVNALGYVLKLLNPVLLVVVTRVYGETQWGVFVAIQAAFFLAARVAMLGLDKAMLWWIPRTTRDTAKEGLTGVLLVVCVASVVATIALGWVLPGIAQHLALSHSPFLDPSHLSTLRWVALSLPVFCVSEILIHATMGRRKMGVQVLVRGTLVPLLIFVVALGLFFSPWRENGLGLAFVVAHVVGLLASLWAFVSLFHDSPWTTSLRVPSPIVRFALPAWGSEFMGTFYQRLDILFLAATTTPSVVGIYGVVIQIGNQVRSIRQAFDPIVIAVISSVGAGDSTGGRSFVADSDFRRVQTTFSRAVFLVGLLLVPVLIVLGVVAEPLLSLFGSAFATGATALRILCVAWLAHGVWAISSTIVAGRGRSDWLLGILVASAIVHSSLLLLSMLLPTFDGDPLTHVATASTLGFLAHSAMLFFAARRTMGGRLVHTSVALWPVTSGAFSACIGGLAAWAVHFAAKSSEGFLHVLVGTLLFLLMYLFLNKKSISSRVSTLRRGKA